jgi:hypothetical protein
MTAPLRQSCPLTLAVPSPARHCWEAKKAVKKPALALGEAP